MQAKTTIDSLPTPDANAQALSQRLSALIRDEIRVMGDLPFSRYMERVLYEPGLGYYSAGSRKFGEAGDFVTAPEISPLFSRCLARQCAQVLEALPGETTLLELGAGSGAMAVDLLSELSRVKCLPDRYLILEPSADLRDRQQRRLAESLPSMSPRIEWLDRWPAQAIDGCIIANEVFDALPVDRFLLEDDDAHSLHVSLDGEQFCWRRAPLEGDSRAFVDALLADTDQKFPREFCSERCPSLTGFVASLSECLGRGAMLVTDYGLTHSEYYLPERAGGTLTCHYRHRAHDDVFFWPGLQDLTAWVDFTALASAATEHGMTLAGYTTQAHFLMASGLSDMLSDQEGLSTSDRLRLAQQVKTLTLPGEMGECFKAIAFLNNMELDLLGFRQRDFSDRL